LVLPFKKIKTYPGLKVVFACPVPLEKQAAFTPYTEYLTYSAPCKCNQCSASELMIVLSFKVISGLARK
jgi:hypothetical protein